MDDKKRLLYQTTPCRFQQKTTIINGALFYSINGMYSHTHTTSLSIKMPTNVPCHQKRVPFLMINLNQRFREVQLFSDLLKDTFSVGGRELYLLLQKISKRFCSFSSDK
jgi:hypothetical protein